LCGPRDPSYLTSSRGAAAPRRRQGEPIMRTFRHRERRRPPRLRPPQQSPRNRTFPRQHRAAVTTATATSRRPSSRSGADVPRLRAHHLRQRLDRWNSCHLPRVRRRDPTYPVHAQSQPTSAGRKPTTSRPQRPRGVLPVAGPRRLLASGAPGEVRGRLDEHPDIALVFPRVIGIDENRQGTRVTGVGEGTERCPRCASRPCSAAGTSARRFYGLVRPRCCGRQLVRNYTDSDRVLLCDLALRGRSCNSRRRSSTNASHAGNQYNGLARQDGLVLPDCSARAGVSFPTWAQFFHYLRVIAYAPLPLRHKVPC